MPYCCLYYLINLIHWKAFEYPKKKNNNKSVRIHYAWRDIFRQYRMTEWTLANIGDHSHCWSLLTSFPCRIWRGLMVSSFSTSTCGLYHYHHNQRLEISGEDSCIKYKIIERKFKDHSRYSFMLINFFYLKLFSFVM